jgi:uncharacterized protein (DUF3084 family)
MRIRNIAIFSAVILASAFAGSLVGPRPAEAVARELIDLQRDVTTLLQGQKDLSDRVIQDHTMMKTLVEQSGDNVGKLSATMGSLQKSVQDVQANSGARLDTMSTQVQGLSDNLEEIKFRQRARELRCNRHADRWRCLSLKFFRWLREHACASFGQHAL